MKKVIITNGHNRSGKDEFAQYCSELFKTRRGSSINPIKIASLILGSSEDESFNFFNYKNESELIKIANNIKFNDESLNEEFRKFLSDLKLLSSQYNNYPFRYIKKLINDFLNSDDELILIDIREPNEIQKIKNEIDCITVLIDRDSYVANNMADQNVKNFNYDYIINNNGTLEEFKEKTYEFLNYIRGEI
jgi:hypothetical protein